MGIEKQKTALVTGAAGFIGYHISKRLLDEGWRVVGLVEKPDADKAPSNLASIGRYVLTPEIFETLRRLKAGSGGEIQLADAINIHAQQRAVGTVRLNGRRFDYGSVDGSMAASNHVYTKLSSKYFDENVD